MPMTNILCQLSFWWNCAWDGSGEMQGGGAHDHSFLFPSNPSSLMTFFDWISRVRSMAWPRLPSTGTWWRSCPPSSWTAFSVQTLQLRVARWMALRNPAELRPSVTPRGVWPSEGSRGVGQAMRFQHLVLLHRARRRPRDSLILRILILWWFWMWRPQRIPWRNYFVLVLNVPLGIVLTISFSNLSCCQLHLITVWQLWPVLTP